MEKLSDERPRDQSWKRRIARLDAAYQAGGHAALEAMESVEPLALRNEKVRDLKMVLNWLEVHVDDQTIQAEKAELVAEINDITRWINAKLRQELREAGSQSATKPRAKGFDLER